MPEILFFPYFGPNRRSDRKVVEIRMDFSLHELSELSQRPPLIRQFLTGEGILSPGADYFDESPPGDLMTWYADLLARTSLLLQCHCGHQVEYHSVLEESKEFRRVALVEHEHSQVGMAAVKLAVGLFFGERKSLSEAFKTFFMFARQRALPIETQTIISVARQRGIPVFQLDREPFLEHMRIDSDIRPNGLLMLGHGASTQVLDGTFCLSRSGERLKAMLKNPQQRAGFIANMGLPLAPLDAKTKECTRTFHFIVINQRVAVMEQLAGERYAQMHEAVHESLLEMARNIANKLDQAPITICIRTPGTGKPLIQTGGYVEDFTLAPDLGRLLGGHENPGLLERAATDLLGWLFPDPAVARMPIIAITGTNGKTTTSRMVNRIMQVAGRQPGLVCTDGIYANGRLISKGDASSFVGHARVLTNQMIDVAVLEAHHRGITMRGFAFDHCEVGVCLNVTYEHLKKGEIETIEEMARIKRAIPEMASDTAILFADDRYCRAMIDRLDAARVCLVSSQSSIKQLSGLVDEERARFCVLENIEQDPWIVLYDLEQRLPILPITKIPATFDGAARFNVSNAMHAAAAAYFCGIDVASITRGLSTFQSNREHSPGRMNVYDDLPFRVIIDFAHNPDGMKKICDFIDQQQVEGRKLIAFSGMAKRDDEVNRRTAQELAGHFDFYFCKDYVPSEPPKSRLVANFMQQVLIDEGVPAQCTAVLKYGREDLYEIFDACKPGDLLLLLLGHVEMHTVPGYIKDYAASR